MAKDHCISCGVETPYDYETHIDIRLGYVEGAGQLCSKCYENIYSDDPYVPLHIRSSRTLYTIPESIILDTPNDQELGAKVRRLYYENNS